MWTLGPGTSLAAGLAFALAVAAGFAGAAWAAPINEPPPSGAILDLNGGLIPHGPPQTYTVDFTSSVSNTAITFAFREDPAFIFLFNSSVVDLTTSSGNLLRNSDFSGGTYTNNGNSATPTSWTYANIYGASAGGIVTSSCGYGSYCWHDGAVQAYDAISQSISTTIGDLYQVSFSATDNSGLTDWSRVSTNGNVTGSGGNGADILVYAQAGLPPAACAGAPGVNIKASAGQTCFASGSYASTNVIAGQATGAGAVLTNVNGGQSSVSFSTSAPNTPAVQADSGGSVTLTVTPPSTSGTVTTTGDNSIGLYATGSATTAGGPVASSITAQNVNVTTQGSNASGVQADTGGLVTLNGGTIATSGGGSLALYATGAGSQIAATNVAASTSASYSASFGSANVAFANRGAIITMNGGSANTTGSGAYAVVAEGAGVVKSTGTSIGTTGDGSGGLGINGVGSEIDATNVAITTTGAYDSATGLHSYGVYNGSYGTFPTGGVATITNSTISTQGLQMYGVLTAAGGVTNLSGDSVATSGQDAHALAVTGSGSRANLNGTNSFATQGAGASGIVASLGGVINATGLATVTTSGGVSSATGFGASGIAADGAGAQVMLGVAKVTTSGPSGFALIAADSTASGSAGSISVTGALTISTTNAAAAAVGLQGDGASVFATGGGSITSAGDAIKFLGGSGQSATFDNFTISALSGDLVFADPSTATVNFNSTTASAGSNNLLNATAGSFVTLNADASALTGAIRTDATSTSNVNLTNGTVWTVTGPSVVTNLAVTNSIVVFAPPSAGGGFKTLTVGNYVGSGANITMNAALGGATQAADQIVVNGGSATGLTLLTIRNVSGLGGQTSGSGVPLVVTTNGGTIAPGAFALAGVPLFGGFRYVLDQSSGEVFLVSTPAPTVAGVTNSVTNLARAQQNQIITNRVLNSILLGATQQISSCSCGGGFASVGSFAAGAQGRWSLSDELTLIGGFSYNQWNASGVTVENAPTVAGSLTYDFWKWGKSRPFLEAGAALTPYENVSYLRSYANGNTWAVGNGSAIDRDLSLFARAGWIDRLTPVDEAAVYGDLSRSWMQTGGYTEVTSGLNPFPATVPTGLDTLNVARVGGQITHLFNGNIETNLSGAVAYGFGAGAGQAVSVYGFGPIAPNALPNTTWLEYGARLGYRYSDRLVIDAFVVGTAFGEVGATLHGGLGVRYSF